ncbi:MAG TPA: hypothetical protein VN835_01885 [Steroidobacteraceae bacterium]|nr:hypothetical protein [Steroidobacteraceae bacterium]
MPLPDALVATLTLAGVLDELGDLDLAYLRHAAALEISDLLDSALDDSGVK